jgi:glycine cleavage system protein P-like pyridoxal-binding family
VLAARAPQSRARQHAGFLASRGRDNNMAPTTPQPTINPRKTMIEPTQQPPVSVEVDGFFKALIAVNQVDILHKAVTLPNQSALEVAMAEVRRNHADMLARSLGVK